MKPTKALGTLLIAIALSTTLPSCYEKHDINSKQLNQQMEDRKVKRVTPGMLIDESLLKGALIANTCNNYVESGCANTSNATSCDPFFKAAADSLLADYGATAKRYVFESKKTPTTNPKIKDLLSAYAYEANNNHAPAPNVQILSDSDYLYTQAITVNLNTCVSCHNAITPQTGYSFKLGQPVGVYLIQLKKRELIRHLKTKS